MRVLWFVKYGPDASHMWDAKPFDRLKDARLFAKSLPPLAGGGERPFVIERFEYVQDKIYGDIVRVSEVSA